MLKVEHTGQCGSGRNGSRAVSGAASEAFTDGSTVSMPRHTICLLAYMASTASSDRCGLSLRTSL